MSVPLMIVMNISFFYIKSVKARDVQEVRVEDDGRLGADLGSTRRRRQALREREITRDVHSTNTPGFHRQ